MAVELSIENGFPVRAEGFDDDVLDGLVLLVAGIDLGPAAPRLAEIDPVGSAAGAGKARWIDNSLGEKPGLRLRSST